MTDDKDDIIFRLRTRLAIVEPVYRAAVAVHRLGASKGAYGDLGHGEILKQEVIRAIEKERQVAEGSSTPCVSTDLP